MKLNWILMASIAAVLAVSLGAFGAHGLKPMLNAAQFGIFKTGSEYHFYHSIALFGIGILAILKNSKLLDAAGILFCAGILLFSGSLYILAVRELLHVEHWTWLGPLTPLGGLCFIGGWILTGIYGITQFKASILKTH